MTIFSEKQRIMCVSDSQEQDIVVSNFGCFESAGVHASDQGLLLSAEAVAGWSLGRRAVKIVN